MRKLPSGTRVTLPGFQFSFIDFDEFHSGQAREMIRVIGYTAYTLANPTEIAVTPATDGAGHARCGERGQGRVLGG